MKNILKLVYIFSVIFIIKTILQIVENKQINSSMYSFISLLIALFIIIYWLYEIFEQIFLFKNQGSKLNSTRINIDEYKKE